MKPGDEIKLVRENLAFALGLWKAAEGGKIPPTPLLRPGSDHPQFNQRAGAPDFSEGELTAELVRSTGNQMRGAFALSALQSQRSMAEAFPGDPIEEEWPELRAARCSLYLIGLAVQRSVLQPVWECPAPYRRLFHIRRLGFTLNATGLEGRLLSWDDFGGLERYLSLLGYCSTSANAEMERGSASRTLPRNSRTTRTEFGGIIGAPGGILDVGENPAQVAPPRGYPGEPSPRRLAPGQPTFNSPPPAPGRSNGAAGWATPVDDRTFQGPGQAAIDGASATPAGQPPVSSLVHRFIEEWCETGEGRRTLAGDLYAGFLRWCRESGSDPVSQRAFGMRLTNFGLTRKRRGHGKHWWEGIRLAGAQQP